MDSEMEKEFAERICDPVRTVIECHADKRDGVVKLLSDKACHASCFDIDALIMAQATENELVPVLRACNKCRNAGGRPLDLARLKEHIENYIASSAYDLVETPHGHNSTSAIDNAMDEAQAHAKSEALRLLKQVHEALTEIIADVE